MDERNRVVFEREKNTRDEKAFEAASEQGTKDKKFKGGGCIATEKRTKAKRSRW